MPQQNLSVPKRRLGRPSEDHAPVLDEWDGLCPVCGECAELTSYLGTDDMRGEEHWWCPHCMLALNVRVVRLVQRARSGRTGASIEL